MKRINLSEIDDDVLIDKFVVAAKNLGLAVLDSETRRANRMYHYLRAIDLELRSRGTQARMKLTPLLNDDDRFVRYYAAQKLLGLVPDRSRSVIEWNYKYRFDAIAGDAGMLLAALDSGEYKPD